MTEKLMKREVGSTGLRVSEVSLGLWGMSGAYGERTSDDDFHETLRAAETAGVNLLDVAPLWGTMESRLGEALSGAAKLEAADDMLVCTRAGIRLSQGTSGEVVRDYSPEGLQQSLKRSLVALKRDRVDVWLLHDPPDQVMIDEKVRELLQAVKSRGEVVATGVATASLDVASSALDGGVEVVCMPLHLLRFDEHADLSFELEETGGTFFARSPLCHGLLTGRWTPTRSFEPKDHRRDRWSESALKLRVKVVNQLRFLVRNDVPSLASAAIRFVLKRERVGTAILGARRPQQLERLAAMVGTPPYLPDADVQRLHQILAAAGL